MIRALWVLIIFLHSFFVSVRMFCLQQFNNSFTGLPKAALGPAYGRYRILRPYIKRDHSSWLKSVVQYVFYVKSLVFERILFDFIYQKVKFSICKQQHGFMKLWSTLTQMIDYLDIVYKSQDN